jgi:hypothetical protein
LNDKIETPKRGVFLFGLALLKFNADVCTLLIFAASARLLREKRVKGEATGGGEKMRLRLAQLMHQDTNLQSAVRFLL